MSSFKPMVKMFTDEPKVILKLKKGGKVASKMEDMAHKPMSSSMSVFESEEGKAPKKPSIMSRVKAMNPNQYKKGGKVAHKQLGGAMGAPAPAAPMAAMSPVALGQMTPAARNARAMAVRRALTGMKKGGSADHALIKKLEKELHHHESMPASKAHKKASGGAIDKAETKTTIEGNAKKFAKTKMHDGQHHDKAHGTGEIKEGKPAGYATGGAIPADTNKKVNKAKTKMGGTYEGNEGDYVKTEMHTAKKDKAHGTGGIKVQNAGGFKKGGNVPGLGNAVEGGDWENRPANTAKPGVEDTTTGKVEESNAGGFKRGGKASKKAYATGGDVDMGQADRTLRQTSRGDTGRGYVVVDKSGKIMSSHKSQSDAIRGALKSDDYKVKRQYASGGNVVDDGKAVKMPKHFVSPPVANSLQSGTFKRGGKVK